MLFFIQKLMKTLEMKSGKVIKDLKDANYLYDAYQVMRRRKGVNLPKWYKDDLPRQLHQLHRDYIKMPFSTKQTRSLRCVFFVIEKQRN